MEKSIYSMQYKLFLDLLREARESGGLTQEDVASKLGVTQSFVSKCERGERRLDIIEARAWCIALGMPFIEFADRFNAGCDAASGAPTS
ncbi:hypothetical protein METUNv1_01574 [Methyloversatilis universalis FAM5]|uniref:HTH cro/C1-type domain-containing protein n=1 Tax=Methyloversatilis universalis (strain ATCC BAA-1314 / DSM 25237 / JCM 13912 / CCUG 52030 / FAM5) TaxID=1000565 RepID=F5RBD1_METUF|nr:helix-turn-helix transcriptional regulator [Methyloversatilis universalis]EGK72102.1 hypothetical protein METUNv1_01574 [Methyloversatilis universalis FAM5]